MWPLNVWEFAEYIWVTSACRHEPVGTVPHLYTLYCQYLLPWSVVAQPAAVSRKETAKGGQHWAETAGSQSAQCSPSAEIQSPSTKHRSEKGKLCNVCFMQVTGPCVAGMYYVLLTFLRTGVVSRVLLVYVLIRFWNILSVDSNNSETVYLNLLFGAMKQTKN